MSGCDPGPALLAALLASATAAGCTAAVHATSVRDWASATFVGYRHRVTLDLAGDGTDRWLAGLPDADWRLFGHFVAAIEVGEAIAAGPVRRVPLDILTLRIT